MDTTEITCQTTASSRTAAVRRGVVSKGFALRLASALLAVLAMLNLPMAQPASAARSITQASNLTCERYDNKLSISPPQVWASYRTEQVTWGVGVQRWMAARRSTTRPRRTTSTRPSPTSERASPTGPLGGITTTR